LRLIAGRLLKGIDDHTFFLLFEAADWDFSRLDGILF
jgi:hypothetical protein